ncbi:MAG: DUF3857 domain-containing protein [Chloroflexi bacterium]|nr:DUF3857 domain-containing protein [Chloroflexota bacterium]
MKKYLVGTILILVVLAMIAPAAAQVQIPGAIFQDDKIGLEITPDGKMVNIEDETVKVLTPDGAKMYQEIVRSWWADSQTLTIESAEVIAGDGSSITLKPEWIKEIQPEDLQNTPYKDFRLTVLTFPTLAPPCTVKYRIVIRNKEPMAGKAFWSGSYTQDFSPIGHTEFEVKIPAGTNMNYKYVGEPQVEPEKTLVGGVDSYVWESTERPALEREPFMPALVDVATKIMVGSFNSWQEFAKWGANVVNKRAEPDSSLRSKLRRVTWGKNEKTEKLKAIYNYVISIPSLNEDPGLRWNTSEPISRIADTDKIAPSDRALLLAGLIRAAGYKATVVLAASRDFGKIIKDFPTPQTFDSLLVYMPEEDKFLDPNDPYTAFGEISQGLLGVDALLLDPLASAPIKLPLISAHDNREEMQAEIVVNGDGDVEEAIGLLETGINRQVWASILGKAKGSELDRLFQFLVRQVDMEARLIDFKIGENSDSKVKIDLNFKIPGYARKSGKYLILPQPVIQTLQFNSILKQQGTRLYPVLLGNPSMEEKRIHVVVPDKYTVFSTPEDLTVENDVGSVQVLTKTEGNSIQTVVRMILKMEEVPPEKFQMITDLVNAINEIENEVYLLEEK